MKDRTNEEGIDPVTDKPTEDASVRGELESRDGGKHGAPQARTMIEEILDPENLALGIAPSEGHKASRSRKGYPPSLKLWRDRLADEPDVAGATRA